MATDAKKVIQDLNSMVRLLIISRQKTKTVRSSSQSKRSDVFRVRSGVFWVNFGVG